jgi:hypothetical protein
LQERIEQLQGSTNSSGEPEPSSSEDAASEKKKG